jgi:hypothetical protein
MLLGNLAISRRETHGFASRSHNRFAIVWELGGELPRRKGVGKWRGDEV